MIKPIFPYEEEGKKLNCQRGEMFRHFFAQAIVVLAMSVPAGRGDAVQK
jgi:hypothetical protein